MEMQAIRFPNAWYCTVFVVQNEVVTILDKISAPTLDEVGQWLQSNSFPTAGLQLAAKASSHIAPGFYIDPHMAEFYYCVNSTTNELVAASPADFGDHGSFHT